MTPSAQPSHHTSVKQPASKTAHPSKTAYPSKTVHPSKAVHHLGGLAIFGICAGALLVVTTIVVVLVFFFRRKRVRKQSKGYELRAVQQSVNRFDKRPPVDTVATPLLRSGLHWPNQDGSKGRPFFKQVHEHSDTDDSLHEEKHPDKFAFSAPSAPIVEVLPKLSKEEMKRSLPRLTIPQLQPPMNPNRNPAITVKPATPPSSKESSTSSASSGSYYSQSSASHLTYHRPTTPPPPMPPIPAGGFITGIRTDTYMTAQKYSPKHLPNPHPKPAPRTEDGDDKLAAPARGNTRVVGRMLKQRAKRNSPLLSRGVSHIERTGSINSIISFNEEDNILSLRPRVGAGRVVPPRSLVVVPSSGLSVPQVPAHMAIPPVPSQMITDTGISTTQPLAVRPVHLPPKLEIMRPTEPTLASPLFQDIPASPLRPRNRNSHVRRISYESYARTAPLRRLSKEQQHQDVPRLGHDIDVMIDQKRLSLDRYTERLER